MTVRSTRQILNALAAICAVCAVGVVVWGMSDVSVPEPAPLRLRSGSGSDTMAQGAVVSATDVANVAMVQLRRSLVDTPPPTKTQAKPIRKPQTPRTFPNPRLTLLVTVIDPKERNVAIFADARGVTDIRGVGEELKLMPSGARVTEIKSNGATIEFRGRKIALNLSRSSPGRTGGVRKPGMRPTQGRNGAQRNNGSRIVPTPGPQRTP